MSTLFAVTMPKWGIEMEEGMITSWLADAGSQVSKGSDLIDIETSKIVNTLECPYDGTLVRRIAEEGETLSVGVLLGVIAQEQTDDVEIDKFIDNFVPVDASFEHVDDVQASSKQQPASKPSTQNSTGQKTVRVSPPVRRLAESLGVDLATLPTDRGRITRQMVEAAAAGDFNVDAADDSPETEVGFETIPMSQTRKTIAKRLTEAKTSIPHYYLTANLNVDTLLNKRQILNTGGEQKVSINDLLIFAVSRALRSEPGVNVTFVDDNIHQYESANISIAIATDDGLMAPVLRNANAMTINEVSTAVNDIVARTKDKKLTSADLENGSFTLSNLGMFGVDSFQAIINPPQGAILAVGSVVDKAVVIDGKLESASVMTVNLSCDHRIIDGATGARFLQALRHEIENID